MRRASCGFRGLDVHDICGEAVRSDAARASPKSPRSWRLIPKIHAVALRRAGIDSAKLAGQLGRWRDENSCCLRRCDHSPELQRRLRCALHSPATWPHQWSRHASGTDYRRDLSGRHPTAPEHGDGQSESARVALGELPFRALFQTADADYDEAH